MHISNGFSIVSRRAVAGLSRDDQYTTWHDHEADQRLMDDKVAFARAAWDEASRRAGGRAPKGFEAWASRHPAAGYSVYDYGAFAWHEAWDLVSGAERTASRLGIVVEARTKLADRPVIWHEAYTPKTERLRQQYEDVVGPGSYFRFEGRDTDTSDEYYVVVSPGGVRTPRANFYAGVRKLPDDYSTGGKYFPDIQQAMQYAVDTWGVKPPGGMGSYTSDDLKGLGKKVKQWRKEHAGEHFDGDDEAKGAATTPVVSSPDAEMRALAAVRLHKRQGYQWFDVDSVMNGADADFNALAAAEPDLLKAKRVAINERARRRNLIAKTYGPNHVESDFYKLWIVHKTDEGTYLVAVSPYLSTHDKRIAEANDKFGVFTWKLNVATQEQIDAKVQDLIQHYAREFGVQLTAEDINVPSLEDNPYSGEIIVGKSGRAKIYGSPEWKRRIMDYYGVEAGRGHVQNLRKRWRDRKAEWKRQLDEAYAQSQENGEAFMRRQPPPPRVDLEKRPYGQLYMTAIYREPIEARDEGISPDERIMKYGFDSMQEAVEKLNTTVMQGAPVGDVPPTTSADLRAARESCEAEVASGVAEAPAEVSIQEDPDEVVEVSPSQQVAPPVSVPPTKRRRKAPKTTDETQPAAKEPAPAAAPAPVPIEGEDVDLSELAIGHMALAQLTLLGLIRIAERFDREGMHDKAEDLHRILRRHIRNER